MDTNTGESPGHHNRANPNSWETHLVRKRWDIGLVEPKNFDDDDGWRRLDTNIILLVSSCRSLWIRSSGMLAYLVSLSQWAHVAYMLACACESARACVCVRVCGVHMCVCL